MASTFTGADPTWSSPTTRTNGAEAEAAGRRFARLWMHSAMVNVGGEKMAKSAGNFRTLADVPRGA